MGNGVNEGNYELEVLPKTPYLYHFSKLRNLIFFIFWGILEGFSRVCGAFLEGWGHF